MYTVYGIYEVGSDQVLYIGSTQDLQLRFANHVNSRAKSKRSKLFEQHRSGRISLEPRIIETFGSRADMLIAERAAIEKHKPAHNAYGASPTKADLRVAAQALKAEAKKFRLQELRIRANNVRLAFVFARIPQYLVWLKHYRPEWADQNHVARIRRVMSGTMLFADKTMLEEMEAVVGEYLTKKAA